MLNLKPPESSCACDVPVERSKRPRDDSDPWNVAWPSDTHRRLEVLGDYKVVVNWMNGTWEVKGEEHAIPVHGVVDQLVRWCLGGTFLWRTDENDWCRHIFCESNKAAATHANWLMDNGDSGPGAQWEAPDLDEKLQKSRHLLMSFDGARRESGLGAAAWILWLRNEYGIFEKVSNGGRVLRNASAMIAEREALRMGIEHLTVLFPTEVSWNVNDAHRAGANRLQNKTNSVPLSLSAQACEMERVLSASSDERASPICGTGSLTWLPPRTWWKAAESLGKTIADASNVGSIFHVGS